MPVSLNDKMKSLSPERQEKIHQHATELVNTSRLAALREAAGMTQANVADLLGTSQANVSQLEKQEDPKVSSLMAYVQSLGGQLDLVARMPSGHSFLLYGQVKQPVYSHVPVLVPIPVNPPAYGVPPPADTFLTKVSPGTVKIPDIVDWTKLKPKPKPRSKLRTAKRPTPQEHKPR